MNPPRLSLVTISKDDPSGLARTVASAAALRAAGAEHVVVDGSAGDPGPGFPAGVRLVRRPARGIADAFNAGLAAAGGEWIWFLNGGDLVDPQLSPEFLRPLLERSRADVIIGGTTYEGEADPRPHPPVHLRWPPFRSWIPHPSTLVRRRLFTTFGPFDERYAIAMDYEWWLRVIPTGMPVDVISVPLAVFAPGGVSQQAEARRQREGEKKDALRRHQAALWSPWFSASLRLLRASVGAWFSRRVRRSPRAP